MSKYLHQSGCKMLMTILYDSLMKEGTYSNVCPSPFLPRFPVEVYRMPSWYKYCKARSFTTNEPSFTRQLYKYYTDLLSQFRCITSCILPAWTPLSRGSLEARCMHVKHKPTMSQCHVIINFSPRQHI